MSVGSGDEVELSSIVQKTGGQLPINKSLAQNFGTDKPTVGVGIEIRCALHFGGAPWDVARLGGEAMVFS